MNLRMIALAGLMLGGLGCGQDYGFGRRIQGTVAVVVGDFDNVQDTFNRLEIDTVRYDGIISTATWVEDEDDFQSPQLSVEGLFDSERNQELLAHTAVFVASGTRGLGEHKYNSTAPDDAVASSELAVDNARAYVNSGGTLVATDWSYDLIERAFPDAIDFLGDDEELDAAQRGEIAMVQAKVVDEELRTALGLDEAGQLSVDMNYSNWAVMESINAQDGRVKVWISGDVTYRDDDGEGTVTVTDAPLLVTINSGGQFDGQIVYSSFHLDAQQPPVVDTLIEVVLGGFNLTQTARSEGE